MNWLISYNHSGNGWVRYCIEYLTQLPTHGHQPFSISERNNNFLNVDLSKKSIVTKRHEIKLNELSIKDKLILLVRHPFDAIKENTDPYVEFNKYYDLIKVYENFNGDKCVINYYELFDIKTIEFIIFFYKLNCDKVKLDNLKNNFLYHQEQSKNVHQNKMNEKGTDLTKYINKNLLEYVQLYL